MSVTSPEDKVERVQETYQKAPWPIHPVLFALYAVIALLAANIQQVSLSDSTRAFAVVAAGTLLLLLTLRLVLRDWQKAGVICTLCLALFFSYGHVYGLLKTTSLFGLMLGRHRILLPLWMCIFTIVCWLIHTRLRASGRLTRALNFAGAVLILIPTTAVTLNLLNYNINIGQPFESDRVPALKYAGGGEMPDIYYIVVDSYVREDLLREEYGYDNHAFIESLRSHGFYVADESESNYMSTALSLASSLNMRYLPDLGLDLSREPYPGPLIGKLKRSAVRQHLESLGYATVALETGWIGTEIYDAAYFLTAEMDEEVFNAAGLNSFESMLIHTSLGLAFTDFQVLRSNWLVERMKSPFRIHRQLILSNFDHLSQIPNIPARKFVFAHILSPHQPYIFGPHGEDVIPEGTFNLAETDSDSTSQFDPYLDQLTYVNTRLERAIDDILINSSTPPIIILQSDHGRATDLHWSDPDERNARTQVAILNAYYLPDACVSQLYPQITPVNSFRLLFDCVFGGDFGLLEDQSYFSNLRGDSPFDFVPVYRLGK